jgi:hypothetical protein
MAMKESHTFIQNDQSYLFPKIVWLGHKTKFRKASQKSKPKKFFIVSVIGFWLPPKPMTRSSVFLQCGPSIKNQSLCKMKEEEQTSKMSILSLSFSTKVFSLFFKNILYWK